MYQVQVRYKKCDAKKYIFFRKVENFKLGHMRKQLLHTTGIMKIAFTAMRSIYTY